MSKPRRYRHQLFIITPGSASKTGIGAPTNAAGTAVEVVGDVAPTTGAEPWLNDRENNEVNTTIRIPYDAGLGLTPKKTIEDRTSSPIVVYDVEEVINHKQRDDEFICRCVART